jgi:plastocyanin
MPRSPAGSLPPGGGGPGWGGRCRGIAGLLALGCLAVLASCQDISALRTYDVPGAALTVHIVDSPEAVGEFEPRRAHALVGQTVAWVNASGDFHTVTFTGGPEVQSSVGIKPGGVFETTFHHPGVYRYRCLYHEPMIGEVDVTSGPTPVPSPSLEPLYP